MILIGSRAVKHWFDDARDPILDYDFVVDDLTVKSAVVLGDRHEFQVIPPISARYAPGDTVKPNDLYTLKLSHVFWPIKQIKQLYDIQFLRAKGCVVDAVLFKELYDYWTSVYGPNTTLVFDKDNAEFFDDYVVRVIDHDELHRMMNPDPLYLLAKKDPDSANISESLFNALPLNVRFELVREEAYVLALERILIHDDTAYWRTAYSKMLRHMICRLTPVWLGLFIAENYNVLVKPSFDFYKLYKQKINGK